MHGIKPGTVKTQGQSAPNGSFVGGAVMENAGRGNDEIAASEVQVLALLIVVNPLSFENQHELVPAQPAHPGASRAGFVHVDGPGICPTKGVVWQSQPELQCGDRPFHDSQIVL